jgi:hypothetical protein
VILLFSALAAAAGAVTVFHLRSRPRGDAVPFPSFQHLEGLAPRQRPVWPLEEPVRWALRAVALILAASALFLARREDRTLVALLVEPGSSQWSDAQRLARGSSGPAIALTFVDGKPAVEASAAGVEAAERARRTFASCSASFGSCMVRAAKDLSADTVVVSSLRERSDTLALLNGFRYLRTAPVSITAPAAEPEEPGSTRVVRRGVSPAARIWAAALTAADGDLGGGDTEIVVLDKPEEAGGSKTVLVPVVTAGGLARPQKVGAVALSEDAALAAGVAGLSLESSLALPADSSLEPLVPPVLTARGRTLFAAATEEDLGRWAHSGALTALARVVLFESGRTVRTTEPAAGSHGWQDSSGKPAPVGITDVAPGRYVRDDRRAELFLKREQSGAIPLTDAELSSLKGRRLDALPEPSTSSRWPLGLLILALALRFVDAPGKRMLQLLPYAAVAAALLVLAANPAWIRRAAVPKADRAKGARTLVFPPDRPRVELLSWELPSEIRTGEAGLLTATLRARKAASRELALSVRPTSGPVSEARRKVTADPETFAVSLSVRSAAEGVSFALVRASVGEEGDEAVVPIVARSREPRRLVLAAAPGWEARAAGEALGTRGVVERITRLGATAVVARGASSEEPLDRLSRGLSGYDLVVLVGFPSEELRGTREAALRRYVEEGGALLFLGGVPRLATLPLPETEVAGESALPSRVTGTFAGTTSSFTGFPAWKSSLPLAGVVLGRLDGAPWIVGRAVEKGRIAALTAPDAWRVGAPGSRSEYETLLYGVAAWLEAGRFGEPVTLSADLRYLIVGSEAIPLPAAQAAGLTVDPVDPLVLLPAGPGRERVQARRQHIPLVTADSGAELSSLLARIPEEPPLPRRVSARDSDAIWLALCAALVLEVALRRRAARRAAPARAMPRAA